mmetsp:Transcript_64229/g.191744  ORF Transcript_64229/g.191744 Transcript_64229/m.191744 type:complete len:212 (-) Transcript_64229:577-1212(-)
MKRVRLSRRTRPWSTCNAPPPSSALLPMKLEASARNDAPPWTAMAPPLSMALLLMNLERSANATELPSRSKAPPDEARLSRIVQSIKLSLVAAVARIAPDWKSHSRVCFRMTSPPTIESARSADDMFGWVPVLFTRSGSMLQSTSSSWPPSMCSRPTRRTFEMCTGGAPRVTVMTACAGCSARSAVLAAATTHNSLVAVTLSKVASLDKRA